MPRTRNPALHDYTGRPGRPQVVVDENLLLGMAKAGMTYQEIADAVGIGEVTLKRKYGKVIRQGRALGTLGVRRVLQAKAEDGVAWAIALYARLYLEGRSDLDHQRGQPSTSPLGQQPGTAAAGGVFVFLPEDERDPNNITTPSDPSLLREHQASHLSRLASAMGDDTPPAPPATDDEDFPV